VTPRAPAKAQVFGSTTSTHGLLVPRPNTRIERARTDAHFLFTAKPTSHLALYRWIELLEPGPDLRTLR